jgi:hypothetical protein
MKTLLLAFNNTWTKGQEEHEWNNGYVIDPEGKIAAGHCSSSDWYLKADLGYLVDDKGNALTGPGSANREQYSKLYPEGFEIEWVEDARAGKNPEMDRRYALNQKAHEESLKNHL